MHYDDALQRTRRRRLQRRARVAVQPLAIQLGAAVELECRKLARCAGRPRRQRLESRHLHAQGGGGVVVVDTIGPGSFYYNSCYW